MRLPVITTSAHKGKVLEIDYERERMTLHGPNGKVIGTVTWAELIEYIQDLHSHGPGPEAREQPRMSLVLKVRYSVPGGKPIESRAGGIGGGGVFIESTLPLQKGTQIAMSLTLPDQPDESFDAKGVVSWVCPKPDQYTFSTGMGVQFVEISPTARKRIVDFVNSLKAAVK